MLKHAAKTPAGKRVVSVATSLADFFKYVNDRNIGLLAAAIAYYGILAFFPFVIAIVAIGSVMIPGDSLEDAIAFAESVFPSDISNLLSAQLQNARDQRSDSLIAAGIALAISVFSVSGATTNIIQALNVMYERKERRSLFRLRLTSFLLTFGFIIGMIVSMPLLFATKDILAGIGVPETILQLSTYGRWAMLIVLTGLGLTVLYHIGPSRAANAKIKWISIGAIVATVIWLAASAVFFWYLSNIATLTKSYSLFAGVIGMMLWLNVSSYIMLIGAAINHRGEKRHFLL